MILPFYPHHIIIPAFFKNDTPRMPRWTATPRWRSSMEGRCLPCNECLNGDTDEPWNLGYHGVNACNLVNPTPQTILLETVCFYLPKYSPPVIVIVCNQGIPWPAKPAIDPRDRVAMIATMGYIMPELFRFPGCEDGWVVFWTELDCLSQYSNMMQYVMTSR
jgi:hypothetical protein